MLSVKAGKIAVLGAACGLIAAAVNVSAMIGTRQAELKLASRCEVCSAASRVEREFARLEQRIAAALVPLAVAGPQDVRLRLDMLDDAVAALSRAPARAFIETDPGAAETVARLETALRSMAPLLDRIGTPDVGEAALAALAPLDFDLSRLVAQADRFGVARVDAAQAELTRLYRIFTSVLAGLFAFGAALLGLVGWHNRQLGLARDGQERSATALVAASEELARANAEITAVNEQLQSRNAALDRRDRDLTLQNRRFDAALNNMTQALCMVDAGDRLVVYNRRFAEFFGLALAPLPGLLFADLLGLAAGPQLAEIAARQRALAVEGGESGFVQEIEALPGAPAPMGRRSLAVSHRPMRDGGWLATYEDVTERRQAESRIAFLARHDALTGLCNRTFFAEQFDAMMAEAARRGTLALVLLLDIDGFGEVNERHGDAFGDALLREIGRRITAAMGDAVVARVGGDEFAVVAFGQADAAEPLAERLRAALVAPAPAGGTEVAVGFSLGHAAAPRDGDTADAATKAAELALASAKDAGGGVARGFVPDMDIARRARRTLEADLRQALPNGEFELYFQPLVNARRVEITGFEALLRWHHPTRGLVSPAEFIPVAEETGLIGEIGRWALGVACNEAALWPEHLTVAVNLSPSQFRLMDLVDTVDRALAGSGLAPNRLEIEITETVQLEDGTLDLLHALRARGIRIAMDDFGTGYSSLSYLRRFPFDKIKIDQGFVRDLASRPECVEIVRSMASLGTGLGMTTTAEGVETAEQFSQLQAAGCDQVQGYHFGRPLPVGQLRFSLPDARAA